MPDEPDVPELAHFRARLNRAADLYRQVGSAWEAYLERHPHRLVIKMHSGGRGQLLMERLIPLPEDVALLLGEYLYQLRSALDNCLYAVAIIAAGTAPPPGANTLQWPICDTADAFEKQRWRLKHLPEGLVGALEHIQPYRAELPSWNSLRLLNDLARVDRHRALHLVALTTAESKVVADNSYIRNVEFNSGDIHDGDALLTFEFSGEGLPSRQHIDGDFEFEVDIADIELSPGPGGKMMRPWGTLAKRLRSMHQAVLKYTEGLVYLALHPGEADEERSENTNRF